MTVLFFVAAAFCLNLAVADPCYQGWAYSNGSCYGYSDAQVPWSEAARVCQIFDGFLAEIESAEENDFVREFTAPRKPEDKVWIGATDIFNEGHYEWLSGGGRPVTFTYWNPGQPSDKGNSGQDCVALRRSNNFTWEDDDCTSNYNFVCESKPLPEIALEGFDALLETWF